MQPVAPVTRIDFLLIRAASRFRDLSEHLILFTGPDHKRKARGTKLAYAPGQGMAARDRQAGGSLRRNTPATLGRFAVVFRDFRMGATECHALMSQCHAERIRQDLQGKLAFSGHQSRIFRKSD